jgi:periplasmic copper chaperone A
MKNLSIAISLAALAWAAPAAAHITLEHQAAHAGSYYKANFKVGHGCGESPIRQIVVNIPGGVRGAKPMRKPGWDLLIERAALAKPYSDHGRMVTEDVVRISWSAKTAADHLPNTHYDEFALHAKLPEQAGPLYWSVSQICAEGRIDWSEVPGPGQSLRQLKAPAALLDLLPAAGGHAH